ncbi:MAG: hypothetical protein DRN40_08375 [Thermoplasmata archaeon]|nr:MAG: hypothetical protein DRN40_08375 [Thermoplasmata archaeon]
MNCVHRKKNTGEVCYKMILFWKNGPCDKEEDENDQAANRGCRVCQNPGDGEASYEVECGGEDVKGREILIGCPPPVIGRKELS